MDEVGIEPHDLLVDGGPIREDGHLRGEPRPVHLGLAQQLLDPGGELRPILLRHGGGPLLDSLSVAGHGVHAGGQIQLQPLAFLAPHGLESLDGHGHGRFAQLRKGLLVLIGGQDGGHVGQGQGAGQGEIVHKVQLLGALPGGSEVGFQQGFVHPDGLGVAP